MKNKVLFKIGGFSVDTKTLLTVGGVIAGIAVIKKLSEKNSSKTITITEDTSNGFANYVDEDFFGYVDEDFMGMHGGDEAMKFGGGKAISFANAGGTENAVYEPNFVNSDAKVPIATDEPNFANSDGFSEVMAASPNAVAKRGLFGRKKKKAVDLDSSIVFGNTRKMAKLRAKGVKKVEGTVKPATQRRRKKVTQVVANSTMPAIIKKARR